MVASDVSNGAEEIPQAKKTVIWFSGLSGYLVEREKPDKPNKPDQPVPPNLARLGRLDEAVRREHAVQRLCDSTAIGSLLSQHDDEVFIVDQDR